MAAIGSVWGPDTWADDTWGEFTWGNAGLAPPEMIPWYRVDDLPLHVDTVEPVPIRARAPTVAPVPMAGSFKVVS